MLLKSGIYKITNKVNGKIYVGSAVSLVHRKAVHLSDLRRGIHHSTKLQRAWSKYGEDAFIFETIIICSKENLLDYEQRCIDGFDAVKSGYNIWLKAGSMLGFKHTPEARQKMSITRKGRKPPPRTPEHTANHAAAMRGKKLPPISAEHRARISAANKGKPSSMLGKTQTLAHRMKISEALKGRTFSPEHLANMSKSRIGRGGRRGMPHTAETKAKLSEMKKLYHQRQRESKAQLLHSQNGDCSSETELH